MARLLTPQRGEGRRQWPVLAAAGALLLAAALVLLSG